MINLVTAIQEQMGFGPFEKIDPNTQQGKKELQQSTASDHYAQAATVAVLLGLYKFGETNKGAENLLSFGNNLNLEQVFFNNEEEPVKKISDYGKKTYEETKLFMERILNFAIKILHKETGENATLDSVHAFLAPQRHNVLVYLPPDLEMGGALNDNTLEDRTNKMEGPVSSIMHKIEDIFSAKDSKKADNN